MGGAWAEVGKRLESPAPQGTRPTQPPPPSDPGVRAPSPSSSSGSRPLLPSCPRTLELRLSLPQDKLCGAFWRLVLAQRWMGQLKTVAGSQMQSLLEAVNTEIHFVTLCTFQVSLNLGDK